VSVLGIRFFAGVSPHDWAINFNSRASYESVRMGSLRSSATLLVFQLTRLLANGLEITEHVVRHRLVEGGFLRPREGILGSLFERASKDRSASIGRLEWRTRVATFTFFQRYIELESSTNWERRGTPFAISQRCVRTSVGKRTETVSRTLVDRSENKIFRHAREESTKTANSVGRNVSLTSAVPSAPIAYVHPSSSAKGHSTRLDP